MCCAAMGGGEWMVLHLLRLGAKQPLDPDIRCPLAAAVEKDHVGVMCILLDNGMGAVGGVNAIV